MDEARESRNDKSTELAEKRTDLAIKRTIIASERTLMAWIRTAISMVGFGFTIYKFFQYLRQSGGASAHLRPVGPRNLGLTFIALGTLALIAAIRQHQVFLRDIGVSDAKYVRSLSVTVAVMVILIGIIAFLSVLLRIGPF